MISEEFKRMQELAGIVNEMKVNNPTESYYAVINIYETPYYITTTTKEEMVVKLNKAYKELTGETYVPYSINDLNDNDIGYLNAMGEKVYTYISDDWAYVSNNRKTFEDDIERFNPQPEKYVFKPQPYV
jgi:hypothetical protein